MNKIETKCEVPLLAFVRPVGREGTDRNVMGTLYFS